MTMKLAEFSQLKKLMMMTMSGAPNEVEFALKRANELLRKHSLDWDAVLNRTVTVVDEFEADPEGGEPDDDRRQVEAAFETVEAVVRGGSFADFIASLREQWDRSGHLSVAQKDALFKAARRAGDR